MRTAIHRHDVVVVGARAAGAATDPSAIARCGGSSKSGALSDLLVAQVARGACVGDGFDLRCCGQAVAVLVRLLGGFAVDIDDRRVDADAFARRSAARLVQLLALTPGRRLHRERVMDALWPDASLEVAANELYKAAHYARRATGAADTVVLRNQVVALFPSRGVVVDLVAFDTAARAALAGGDPTAESALALCPGELLPDEPYATWAFQPRQRVELLRRELLRACGRWAELVALDPTDEQAHLGLANVLLDGGDRAGALRQLDVLERVLRDELGIGLSRQAYDLRVRALDTPVAAPRPASPGYAGLVRQPVRFCRTIDEARLA